jgi:hypothetical protein
MWFRRLYRQQPNTEIQASTLANTADVAEWASKIKANPPLAVMATAAGPLIRMAGPIFGVQIGTASGIITARVGTTPGTGSLAISTWNGTALGTLGVPVPVRSISSTTGGIPDGTFCIALRILGAYWVIVTDCGN